MLSSDASLGMWATDGGRTQVPGFLVHLVYNTFIHFINSFGLIQYGDQPTRRNNILDLVLCSHPSFIRDVIILSPIGESDHNVVICCWCLLLT
jgi:hypothetical protein